MIKRDELDLMEAVLATERHGSHGVPYRYWYDDGPMHQKRLYAVLDKWDRKGLWEYGVSARAGWVIDIEKFRLHYEACKKARRELT